MNTTPPSAHHIFVQSVPASTMQPGVQATIVVDRNESHEGVERDFLVPHTVYLTGVEKNQRFQRFSDTFSTALAMPIQDYLNILLFFKIAWPEIELEMKKNSLLCTCRQKKSLPDTESSTSKPKLRKASSTKNGSTLSISKSDELLIDPSNKFTSNETTFI